MTVVVPPLAVAGFPSNPAQSQAPVDDGGLPDGWIRVRLAALSACGPVREQNEDRVGWTVLGSADSVRSPGTDEPVTAELTGPGVALVVADGLGGHSYGELASRTAVGYLLRRMVAPDAPTKAAQLLRTGFEEANEACLTGRLVEEEAFDRDPLWTQPRSAKDRRLAGDDDRGAEGAELAGREPDRGRGGQTTLTSLVLTGLTGNLAHVGDTRIFRLRDDVIELLTNDHTQARELVRMRVIKPEQVLTHPGRHLLTRSIGGDLMVRVDERSSPPEVGDAYLLCTDGLWGSITGFEAHAALMGDLAAGVADLVRRSAERGGDDNASVIALRVTELGRPLDTGPTGWRFPWRR